MSKDSQNYVHPSWKKYQIEESPFGVIMDYCNSCAGSVFLNEKDWVINPQLHAQPNHR